MNAKIEYVSGKKMKTKIRNFEVFSDLPEIQGGENSNLTSTELFIAAFGSCVCTYIANYITDVVRVPAEGLKIDMSWNLKDEPRMVSDIIFDITLPQNEKLEIRKSVIRTIANKCTVNNILSNPPHIDFTIK